MTNDTIHELEWTFLTPLVNEIKPVQSFLNRLLLGRRQTVPTDAIEIGRLIGDRSMAPFVQRGAEAVMVEGLTQDAILVRPTHMRIKKPFTPSALLFNRDFGQVVHLQNGQNQISMVQEHVARDTQRMVDLLANAEEYLASMMLTGTLAYSNETDGTAFSLTFARDSGNAVTLTGADLWTASTSDPSVDVLNAKRQIADQVGLIPTDVIMGQEAAVAFMANVKVLQHLDNRKLITGTLSITNNFNEQGVIFLGDYAGIRWWEYSRSIAVPGLSGTQPLVRSKFAEFVCATPAADMVNYFGPIEDISVLRGQSLQAERFSKSWEVPDPSAIMQLIESHPLPVPRRPNALYSLQVVA